MGSLRINLLESYVLYFCQFSFDKSWVGQKLDKFATYLYAHDTN